MKNLRIKLSALAVLAIVAIVLLASSCQKHKQIINTPTNVENPANYSALSSDIDYEAKYDDIIRCVSYGILNLSQNQQFRNIVASEVDKKFDGDDNVLLKTLSTELSAVGINLANEMNSSLVAHGQDNLIQYIDEAINGFSYFDETLYPQIFIPFIEGKNVTNTTPVICLNFQDDEVLPGIDIRNGNLTFTDITETIAMNDNIYVISVNENINNLGELSEGFNTGGDPMKPLSSGDRFLKINNVNITDKKEGWGNGRAELCHATQIYRPTNNTIDDFNAGTPFCKLASADLNKWYTVGFQTYVSTILSNFIGSNTFSAQWEEQYNEELKAHFYEKDRRKKFAREVTLFTGQNKIYYRSKESAYGTITPAFYEYNILNTSVKVDYALTGGTFRLQGSKVY